jgi:hypothetical protein
VSYCLRNLLQTASWLQACAEFRRLIKTSVIDLLRESAPQPGELLKALTAQTRAAESQRAQAAFDHLQAYQTEISEAAYLSRKIIRRLKTFANSAASHRTYSKFRRQRSAEKVNFARLRAIYKDNKQAPKLHSENISALKDGRRRYGNFA